MAIRGGADAQIGVDRRRYSETGVRRVRPVVSIA
jgi:hypothetical protein